MTSKLPQDDPNDAPTQAADTPETAPNAESRPQSNTTKRRASVRLLQIVEQCQDESLVIAAARLLCEMHGWRKIDRKRKNDSPDNDGFDDSLSKLGVFRTPGQSSTKR